MTDIEKLAQTFNEWADEMISGYEGIPYYLMSARLVARISELEFAKLNLARLAKEVEKMANKKECETCANWKVLNPHHIEKGQEVKSCVYGELPNSCRRLLRGSTMAVTAEGMVNE